MRTPGATHPLYNTTYYQSVPLLSALYASLLPSLSQCVSTLAGPSGPALQALQQLAGSIIVGRQFHELARPGQRTRTAARLLRPRGTLSLIWRADWLADVLEALKPAFGAATVLPIYAKPGESAIRVLVRATKASRSPLQLLPGLVLHDQTGHATVAADAILRAGEALPLAQRTRLRINCIVGFQLMSAGL